MARDADPRPCATSAIVTAGIEAAGPPSSAPWREDRVFLGLGSNLGDRRGRIREALAVLGAEGTIQVVRLSELRETEPVGGPSQGRYINGVAEIRTRLEPRALLSVCLRVEARLGRVRSVRHGPREIDLDLLIFGARVVREADLEIPHPRMIERRFVLEPLAELAPELIHPLSGRTVLEHLCALDAQERGA